MAKKQTAYHGLVLSRFCMQVSILLKSGVPLFEGLEAMAEEARSPEEKEMLLSMSEQLRMGEPFSKALKEAQAFPGYVIQMSRLGESTGTLDVCMENLADHYEQEYVLAENLRKAVTYPFIMMVMLLVILFVLFAKVMPVFSGVYESLGTALPPAAEKAIRLGALFSGAALVLALAGAAVTIAAGAASRAGREPAVIRALYAQFNKRSSIARAAALRRLCSALSISMKSGLRTEEGLALAAGLVQNESLKKSIEAAKGEVEGGSDFYTAIKKENVFSGFDLQMLKIGARSGQLDQVLDSLSGDYARKSIDSIERMIALFEPAVVAVLAVVVGLVLLSVMLPLAGILSTIGV